MALNCVAVHESPFHKTARLIIDRIANNDSTLREVSFTNQHSLKDRDIEKLFRVLSNNRFVKILSLKKVPLKDTDALILARTIRDNNTLEKLQLDGTCLTANGILRILAAIKFKQNIREICMSTTRSDLLDYRAEQLIQAELLQNRHLRFFGMPINDTAISKSISDKMRDNRR